MSDTKTAQLDQVGGDHYRSMPIQPAEFIHRNGIGYLEGNIIKYVVRHRTKGKAQDIQKAIHYCRLLLELEYGEQCASYTAEQVRKADQ